MLLVTSYRMIFQSSWERLAEVLRLGLIANDLRCSPRLTTSQYKLHQRGIHLPAVRQGRHGGLGKRQTRLLVWKWDRYHQYREGMI